MLTPLWLADVPDDQREVEFERFRCRLAALYRGPNEPVPETGCGVPLRGATAKGLPLILPGWVSRVPREDRRKAELYFLVRAAALFASRGGTLSSLSLAVGLNDRGLSTYTAINSGRSSISPMVARGIEEACSGAVTRQQLNPSVFGP